MPASGGSKRHQLIGRPLWVEPCVPPGSSCQPTEYESPSDSRMPLTGLAFAAVL